MYSYCFIDKYALFCTFFASWHSPATLTEVFPCFLLSCKSNVRVYLAKTGHGPHSFLLVKCVVLYIVFVLMCTLLLPLGANPIAVKYIIISYDISPYHILYITYHIIYHISCQKIEIVSCENLTDFKIDFLFNPLNAELNPICHLLALLGVHHFLHVSRVRVKIPSSVGLPFETYGLE